jgi:hypothetical protein
MKDRATGTIDKLRAPAIISRRPPLPRGDVGIASRLRVFTAALKEPSMRIRYAWPVLLLLVPTAASAHDHFADVCFGVSDAYQSHLWGPHVTFTKTIPSGKPGEKLRNWGAIGDFSTHWGDHDDVDVRFMSYMGGLRYSFAHDEKRMPVPFVQALIGGVHTKLDETGDADPALAMGVGLDWRLRQKHLAVRVQGDYIVQGGEITPRISFGLVIYK